MYLVSSVFSYDHVFIMNSILHN